MCVIHAEYIGGVQEAECSLRLLMVYLAPWSQPHTVAASSLVDVVARPRAMPPRRRASTQQLEIAGQALVASQAASGTK